MYFLGRFCYLCLCPYWFFDRSFLLSPWFFDKADDLDLKTLQQSTEAVYLLENTQKFQLEQSVAEVILYGTTKNN